MIDHLSLGTRDLERAAAFYDPVLAELGLRRVWTCSDGIGYGVEDGMDRIAIKLRPGSSPPGEGTHFALAAPSRPAVDGFFRVALERGGSTEGAPGLRDTYGPGYYAAYVRDPDGHRIEAVCHESPESIGVHVATSASRPSSVLLRHGDLVGSLVGRHAASEPHLRVQVVRVAAISDSDPSAIFGGYHGELLLLCLEGSAQLETPSGRTALRERDQLLLVDGMPFRLDATDAGGAVVQMIWAPGPNPCRQCWTHAGRFFQAGAPA